MNFLEMRTCMKLMCLWGLLLTLLVYAHGITDWCEENCGDEKHIRCALRKLTRNKKCSRIEVGMNSTERMQILDFHNKWRNYVASNLGVNNSDPNQESYYLFRPDRLILNTAYQEELNFYYIWNDTGIPQGMRQLSWDYDLECNAAFWASQCTLNLTAEPYHCAGTEDIKMVHMNVATLPPTRMTPMIGFETFLSYINYPDNFFLGNRTILTQSYESGIWDPFYYLMYSNTTSIGCTFGRCYCGQSESGVYGPGSGSIVCLYGPTFRPRGRIYELDTEPCLRCPLGTYCKRNTQYPFLCARPEDDTHPVEIPDKECVSPRHLSSLHLCCGSAVLAIIFYSIFKDLG